MFIIIAISLLSASSLAKPTALIGFGLNPGELSASYFQGAKDNKNLIDMLLSKLIPEQYQQTYLLIKQFINE